jgi:hypothetical protein
MDDKQFNFGNAQQAQSANPLDGLSPEQAHQVMVQQIALYLSKGEYAKGSSDEKKKFNEERAKAGNVITQWIKSQGRDSMPVATPEGPRWLHIKTVKRKATVDRRFVASVFHTFNRHYAAQMHGKSNDEIAYAFADAFAELRDRAGDTEEKLVILKSEPKAAENTVRDLTAGGGMV